MRILFITNDFPNHFEPAKAVFNGALAKAIAREHEIFVISPISWIDELRAICSSKRLEPIPNNIVADHAVDRLEVCHPRYYYPPRFLRRWYGWFYWISIRKAVLRRLKSHPPDAVLSYWIHPDGEAALRAAGRAGTPAVVMTGGSDLLLLTGNHARRRCIQSVLRSANAVVAVSHDLRDRAISLGTPPDKVHVIGRGIDTSAFHPGDQASARGRLGISSTGKIIVWVGRLAHVKGLDILLEACAQLQAAGTAFHLYLVGKGPLRQSLQKQMAARRLQGVVTFAGVQPHASLPDWYRAADLVVLPSRSEGSPNVLREARACGVGFVASRVGGIPDLCRPTDRLVPPEDPAALADAIAASLAQGRPEVEHSQLETSWDESAASLLRLISSLPVAQRNSCKGALSSSPRQIIRNAMSAVVPRSMFLTQGPAGEPTAAMTFDDGPHPEYTPRVLDALARREAKATFFLIGRLAERYPDLVRRIAQEGHTIGNHSFEHSDPEQTSMRRLLKEVWRTDKLLFKLVGPRPRLFRPPNGNLTLGKLCGLWSSGQTVVLWNRDPKDYACRSAADLRSWVRENPTRGGDLFLFHDCWPHVASVLDELVDRATDAGLRFVTVSRWAGRS